MIIKAYIGWDNCTNKSYQKTCALAKSVLSGLITYVLVLEQDRRWKSLAEGRGMGHPHTGSFKWLWNCTRIFSVFLDTVWRL